MSNTQPSQAQLEAAARHYLNLRGSNPDEMLKLEKPMVGANGPINAIPRWQAVVPGILDQWRLLEAINVGSQEKS